jgi:hypothetical protein
MDQSAQLVPLAFSKLAGQSRPRSVCGVIPANYFDRPDTPAKNSPVGTLMQKIDTECPDRILKPFEPKRARHYSV